MTLSTFCVTGVFQRHGVSKSEQDGQMDQEFVRSVQLDQEELHLPVCHSRTGRDSLWWHAHSSWLRATVYGALIIHPKDVAKAFLIASFGLKWLRISLMIAYNAARGTRLTSCSSNCAKTSPVFPSLPAYNDTATATAFTTKFRSPRQVEVPTEVSENLFFTVGLGLNSFLRGAKKLQKLSEVQK
ncbi:hypothetical protein HAX54_036931 [Datura stramonium]|uniref:Uncharacterized protein n=1 Tax=Datura stramonium TaxID=4076 RepID=A0ABS8VJ69_DATST|nr:hypothetical protein [Datura stramonium]